jgi:serine/threonine-protein kinase RsbW
MVHFEICVCKNEVGADILIKDQITIKSNIETVAHARHWAAHHAETADFDKNAVFAIELAVGEAVTNIIRHAYQNQPGHKIHLSLTIDEEKFSLCIRDFGRKFDPANHPPPNLDTPREGGYGIYLMKEVMDEVTYNTSPAQGTRLNLVKYRTTIS